MSEWFACHVIMYVRFKDKNQNKYPIWENVFLVEAESSDIAYEKAKQIGQDAEGDSSGSFHWEDRPSEWVFSGVRKVIACVDSSSRPGDGTEITYSEMLLSDEESLSKFVNGEPVFVLYEE